MSSMTLPLRSIVQPRCSAQTFLASPSRSWMVCSLIPSNTGVAIFMPRILAA
jgi:hypothetical protein